MFKIGLLGDETTMQCMDYFQLMDLLPDARFNISPEEGEEYAKKCTIPPGADPKKYMKVTIQMCQEIPSGKHFAKILPNDKYMDYLMQKLAPSSSGSLNNEMPPKEAIVEAPVIPKRPRLSIGRPLETDLTMDIMMKMLREMSPPDRRRVTRFSLVNPDHDVDVWTPDRAVSANISEILSSPIAYALYQRGYSDAKNKQSKM